VTPAEVAAALVAHPRFAWDERTIGMWHTHAGHTCVTDHGDIGPGGLRRDGSVLPALAHPATAGVLLGMLVAYRGGMFDRAMESIEDTDEHGRTFYALIDVYGLGFMCARALLACWGPA
jgi:hypothetical protein